MADVTPLNYERYTVVVGPVLPLEQAVVASKSLPAVKITPKRTDYNLPQGQANGVPFPAALKSRLNATRPPPTTPNLTFSSSPSAVNTKGFFQDLGLGGDHVILPSTVAENYEKALSIQ